MLKRINETPELSSNTSSQDNNILAEKKQDQTLDLEKENSKTNFKIKIKISKEDLYPQLHDNSEDFELSLELTNSNKDELSNPDFINQLTSKVVKGIKSHFEKDKTSQNYTGKAKIGQKSTKSKLRKSSKTKSMQFLLENRPLKKSRVTLKPNKEIQKHCKKINDSKILTIVNHNDKENSNTNGVKR